MRSAVAAGGSARATRDPEATHEAILAAAQAMMAEHGPQGLTVSDVARRAGVNRGTAYQHFPTRERLIDEVLERLGRRTKRMLDASARANAKASAAPALNDRIDETVDYFVAHPELVRVSLFRMLAGIPHPSEDLWDDYVGRVRQLAARPGGRDGIDAEMLAVVLLGATMLWSLRVESGAESAAATERYCREIKRLMLDGVVRRELHRDLAAAVGAQRAAATRSRRPRPAVAPEQGSGKRSTSAKRVKPARRLRSVRS